MLGKYHASAAGIALATAMSVVSTPALAQQATYDFDIPAQPLTDALSQFGQTTRQQLVYDGRSMARARSSAVVGSYSAEAALRLLLQGTPYKARLGRAGAFIIEARSARLESSRPPRREATVPAPPEPQIADEPTAQSDQASEIIVTGTRTTGLRASDSPAPVQVLGSDALKRVGQTDLMQALAQTLPSFQAQAWGAGLTAFKPSVRLRGLNPNHTLVLINGKRRHGTSMLSVTGGIFSGSAAPDLGLLPQDAIDRIEVLQDGAAAQYGTDAIAGVVNLILKKADHGGTFNATAGQYFDGGGRTWDVMGNIGLAPAENLFLNITAEHKFHDYSFRGDLDPRVIDTGVNTSANTGVNGGRYILANFPDVRTIDHYPKINRYGGDGRMKLTNLMFNAGYDGLPGIEIYAFGTWSRRISDAIQSYRLPNAVTGKSPTDIPFPLGFLPRLGNVETDYAVTAGIRGELGATTYDLGIAYGRDFNRIRVLDSANAALYYDSSQLATATTPYQRGYTPRDVHAGNLIADQWTASLDLTREIDLGLAAPVDVAAGLEYRHESYEIQAGELASYYSGTGARAAGIQSFFGYSPLDAGKNHRRNVSAYIDVNLRPTDAFVIDAAVRHEDYSDFGDTTVFKLTSRYDFSPAFAIRGTASTGFRAPTLAEASYSGINVAPASVIGVFAPGSPGAGVLGIRGLRPEKSTNFSAGFVAHPVSRMTVTLDFYSIKLRDRIVQSNGFLGYNQNCKFLPGGYAPSTDVTAAYNAFRANPANVCNGFISPAVISALQQNGVGVAPVIQAINGGAAGNLTIMTFVNGVDTLTQGADFLLTYASDFGNAGTVDWSLSANINRTRIKKVAPPPANLNQAQPLLDIGAQSILTDATPRYRIIAGAFWKRGPFSVNLRQSYFGPSSYQSTLPQNTAVYVEVPNGARFITDLELTAELDRSVKLSIGANNLFNSYPNELPAIIRQQQYALSSIGYVARFPNTSPIGLNGGYYYARMNLRF